jgi:sulfite exporter TauE/SafE
MTVFHISRLISFFIFGGILGSIGSLFFISNEIEFLIGIVLTVIMIILGINLLDISHLFRRFELTIPKKLSTELLKNTKNSPFAPILFGAITFVLPCGFTQAMQLNAVLSGTFLQGALTMLIFSIGTLPILLLITQGSTKIIGSKHSDLFLKSSGFLVIFFTIYNLIGLLIANGIII